MTDQDQKSPPESSSQVVREVMTPKEGVTLKEKASVVLPSPDVVPQPPDKPFVMPPQNAVPDQNPPSPPPPGGTPTAQPTTTPEQTPKKAE